MEGIANGIAAAVHSMGSIIRPVGDLLATWASTGAIDVAAPEPAAGTTKRAGARFEAHTTAHPMGFRFGF